MIWTMTQMINQWQHLGVILEELERSIIGTKGKLNNEVECWQYCNEGRILSLISFLFAVPLRTSPTLVNGTCAFLLNLEN